MQYGVDNRVTVTHYIYIGQLYDFMTVCDRKVCDEYILCGFNSGQIQHM